MSGPARLRKPPDVADAITNHRHAVAMQLGDQYAGLRFVSLRLDQYVGPVDRKIKRLIRLHLKANVTNITPAIAFVNRAAKGSRDLLTMFVEQFFRAGHKTTHRVAGLIAVLQNVFGKVAGGARIGDDTSRLPAGKLAVISRQGFRRQAQAIEPAA